MVDDKGRVEAPAASSSKNRRSLAHARFGSIDAIVKVRGPLPAGIDVPLVLAGAAEPFAGPLEGNAEIAEKKPRAPYALHPDRPRAARAHIAAGRAVWRIGRPSGGRAFPGAAHISRWTWDTAGMLRTTPALLPGGWGIHRAAGDSRAAGASARDAGLYEVSFSLNQQASPREAGPAGEADHGLSSSVDSRAVIRGKSGRLPVPQRRLRGDLAKADPQVRGALSEAEEHGFEREQVIALEYLGDLALDRHENQSAIESYDRALGLAEKMAPEGDLVPELRRRIAEIHVRIGEPNRALITCERGLRVARKINDRFEEAATYRVMSMAHLLLSHREKAIRTAHEASFLRSWKRSGRGSLCPGGRSSWRAETPKSVARPAITSGKPEA
jgi:tetratricopeptide (TPR) repeat protein